MLKAADTMKIQQKKKNRFELEFYQYNIHTHCYLVNSFHAYVHVQSNPCDRTFTNAKKKKEEACTLQAMHVHLSIYICDMYVPNG